VSCVFVFSRVESAPVLPPELAELDALFLTLKAERVTGPFDDEVKKLNGAYLNRVTKMIAEQKADGHLDAIIALGEEQAFIAFKQTIPETDEEKTPVALKEMRGIYREAQAKLVATRDENLAALTGPLATGLAQMESDLAKADRIADAKLVRGYREALGEGSAGTPARTETTAGGAPALQPATTLALKDGVVNSLGMKFLPVKGTDVLFCIHEVRY
jgi:hypothetical protein